jgi:hypothetical protein
MKKTRMLDRSAGLLILLLCLACVLSAAVLPASAEDPAAVPFRYEHDPRLNPRAMEDIVADPAAVYGFRPSPEGSLKAYADLDWSDPELVNGENGREARIAYHESINDMYSTMNGMLLEGKSIEEIARVISARRNELRLDSYRDDPEMLAAVKERNLEKYGHEEGPLPDELYAQYGSWETVLEKAFSVNSGMDACLGLYDDYYELYVISGQVEDASTAPASREYAVAAFTDAAGIPLPGSPEALSAFGDRDLASPWYSAELTAAAERGILRGYEDGTLRPREGVSRLEALLLLSRCLPEPEAAGPAPDFSDVPSWAREEIARLSAAGLAPDRGDGVLGAADRLTVEQVDQLAAAAAQLTAAGRLEERNG